MGKKIGLLTGGGDCPGLNPALRGVVMRGLDHGFEFTGFLEGWRGLVEGNTQLVTLVACGGEDTLGVASKLFKEHKVPVVGVPKTMDNDLSATDYTFGFDTATTIAVDAAERLRDTGRSHRRIMVLEVMGRHAGWVALFTAMA